MALSRCPGDDGDLGNRDTIKGPFGTRGIVSIESNQPATLVTRTVKSTYKNDESTVWTTYDASAPGFGAMLYALP